VLPIFASLFLVLALASFDNAPGDAPNPPLTWPDGSGIGRTQGRAQLVMFVHPLCGCTSASVRELETLTVGRRLAAAQITFAVYRPESQPDWDAAALKRSTGSFPGSVTMRDDGGVEARRFGVKTSGTVLLYSALGRLLFHGGITGSRGHEGDNYGITRLAAALRGGAGDTAVPVVSRVFGCALGAE
jgi:hypothetical protein